MLRTLFTIACATVLLALPLQADDKSAKDMPPAIEGYWAVTEASAGGTKVELPHSWTFKTNGKANLVDRKEGKQSLFRFKLDDSVTPHRIELVYLGPDDRLKSLRQIGIWKLDGDNLTMLLQEPMREKEAKNDKYPTDIEKPGEKDMLMVLEKQKLE